MATSHTYVHLKNRLENTSGAKLQENMQKPEASPHQKHKDPKREQKQKFAPENLSHKPTLRRRELCQKTAKDKNQTTKNTTLLPSKKRKPNPQIRKNESQKPKAKSQIWEAKDRRGGGAHGPPRNLQRSILRVLDTEETQGLPRLGNRPQDSSVKNIPKWCLYSEGVGPDT